MIQYIDPQFKISLARRGRLRVTWINRPVSDNRDACHARKASSDCDPTDNFFKCTVITDYPLDKKVRHNLPFGEIKYSDVSLAD